MYALKFIGFGVDRFRFGLAFMAVGLKNEIHGGIWDVRACEPVILFQVGIFHKVMIDRGGCQKLWQWCLFGNPK